MSLSQAKGVSAGSPYTLTGYTQGSVLFVGAGGALSEENADFNYDASTNTLTIGGAYVAPTGVVGTPTYRFAGDANSGFYSEGNDYIGVSIGGSRRLIWGPSFAEFSYLLGVSRASTNTTLANETGHFYLQNGSNTNNNFASILFNESSGFTGAAIYTQLKVHSGTSNAVAADLIIATKQAAVAGGPVETARFTSDHQFLLGPTTSNGVDKAEVSGSIKQTGQVLAITTKTASYTLTAEDWTVLGDATAGAIELTLPSAATHWGRVYNLKKIDATGNAVTIVGTTDGVANRTIVTQYENRQVQSNGTNWSIL